MTPTHKRCRTCRMVKPRSDYYPNRSKRGPNGIQSDCKPCQAQRNSANAGRWRETRRSWERRTWRRRNRTAHRCGVTEEKYRAKLEEQDRCCGVCREPLILGPNNMPSPKAVLDHDHETNEFRGILCPTCNGGLGHVGRVDWLPKAIAYLERDRLRENWVDSKV